MKRLLLSTLAFFGLMAVMIAEEANSDWIFKGHVQTRTEVDGRDFSNKTYAPVFTSMRTRFSVAKNINNTQFFVQLSDSRVMGDAGGTLNKGTNLDLHQAYVQMNGLFGMPMDLQVGRFEMKYGTQRFIGPVGWHYVGRSFDGVRAKFNFSKSFKLDVFTTLERNGQGYVGIAKPDTYSTGNKATSLSLSGLWATIKANKEHKIDIFGYYELDRVDVFAFDNSTIDATLSRSTIGASHWGKFGAISTITEFAFQMGTTTKETEDVAFVKGADTTFTSIESDLTAYTASFQIHYNFDDGSIGLGADIVSGTAWDANKDVKVDEVPVNNTFATSFGTNHKFYGYMDYFIAVHGNTGGRGLNDFYLMFKYKLDDNLLFGTNIHHFTTNATPLFTNVAGESVDGETGIGQEFDFFLKYSFSPSAKITFGQSVFLPGDWMKDNFMQTDPADITKVTRGEDMAFWSYIMFQISM